MDSMILIFETMELYKLNNKIYPCSTTVTMDYIGGKWKTVILWYLAISPHRYSELRKKLMMVTERTLSLLKPGFR